LRDFNLDPDKGKPEIGFVFQQALDRSSSEEDFGDEVARSIRHKEVNRYLYNLSHHRKLVNTHGSVLCLVPSSTKVGDRELDLIVPVGFSVLITDLQ
jgi:hypothetical protein